MAPSRPDTKGGVAAAASLRRSRSPESPRLRLRLRLLLSLRLFPALSVSGLWCSAGGSGRGDDGGGAGGATKPTLRLRTRDPARPCPSLPGLLGRTPRKARGVSHPNRRGQGGAGSLGRAEMAFFLYTHICFIRARLGFVCLSQRPHIFLHLTYSSELRNLAPEEASRSPPRPGVKP